MGRRRFGYAPTEPGLARSGANVRFVGQMEALRGDIGQSNKPRMSGRRDGVPVERRQRWSDEEKLAILKETTQPGAIMAVVARRYGIGTGQLYTWRKQLLRGAMAGFVLVELVREEPPASRSSVLNQKFVVLLDGRFAGRSARLRRGCCRRIWSIGTAWDRHCAGR